MQDVDPLLGPLQSNGGPTFTHEPLPSSPAIDMGHPGISFDPTRFDQRGFPFVRVVGGRIDMGAVEVQSTPNFADFDGDFDIDGADFLAWQRGFGASAPNANKSDGDADNDQDVDGEDLSVWQRQFGQPTSLLAAVSETQANPNNTDALATDASPIDAAMALEWSISAKENHISELSAVVENSIDEFFATNKTPGPLLPSQQRSSEFDADTTDVEAKETGVLWLDEELLESLLG